MSKVEKIKKFSKQPIFPKNLTAKLGITVRSVWKKGDTFEIEFDEVPTPEIVAHVKEIVKNGYILMEESE